MVSERRPTDEPAAGEPPDQEPADIGPYLHDDTTGLPRREIFEDRLRHARSRAERRSEVFAIVLLEFVAPDDLPDQSAEALREALAARVTEPLRISDTVAVYGPTELAIILEDVSNQIGAQVAVARMMEIGRMPSVIAGKSFSPVIKAGIAVSAPPHITVEQLVDQAEQALRKAYERQGSDFVTYTPGY